jgi:hypothetical protein
MAMMTMPDAWTAIVNAMSDSPQAQLFSKGSILRTDPIKTCPLHGENWLSRGVSGGRPGVIGCPVARVRRSPLEAAES